MKLSPTQVHTNLLTVVEPRDNLLAEIVRHHRPTEHDGTLAWCEGCDPGRPADEAADWPCSTIRLITGRLSGEINLDPDTGLRRWISAEIVRPESR